MLRAMILVAIICICWGMQPSIAADTLSLNRFNSDTTSSTETNMTPSLTTDSSDEVIESNQKQQERYYHPVEDKKAYVIEEFSHQSRDGSYEYKYILSNGVTRYEKSYWRRVGKGRKFLARKGFYSHPLPNHKFMTVFYTADEHGFLQDSATYSDAVPTLPKHLDVPQLEFPQETDTIITTTTARKPTTTRKITTRKPKDTTTQRPAVKASKFNWIY